MWSGPREARARAGHVPGTCLRSPLLRLVQFGAAPARFASPDLGAEIAEPAFSVCEMRPMALADMNDGLREMARERVLAVEDDPEGRYYLRKAFYRRYGFIGPGPAGYGNSELSFLRWAIERGILNPLEHPRRPGSPWWRAVNEKLMYDAELAALLFEAGAEPRDDEREARMWLDYLRTPSPSSWYRAHNASVVFGYQNYTREAQLESEAERRFIVRVLDRLLFAQALVIPGGLAEAGSRGRLASPEGPFVDFAVRVKELYPRNYPLLPEDVRALEARGDGGVCDAVDEGVIAPRLREVRATVAVALGISGGEVRIQ